MPKKKVKQLLKENKGTGVNVHNEEGKPYTAHYVAESISDVWDKLKMELADPDVEVTLIQRQVPVLGVIKPKDEEDE